MADRAIRGRRVHQHPTRPELPGEVKVTMGFLILFALVSFMAAALTAGAAISGGRGALRILATNLSLLALYAVVFVGLLRRTRWAWWTATLLFGALAAFMVVLVLRSLFDSARDLSARTFQEFQVGAAVGLAVGAFFAAPFVLLMASRRRYFRACVPPARE